MADKGGSGGEDLLKLLMATGLMGGGQTHEQIIYGRESQVWVQVLQALALVGSVVAVAGGLWLMAGGLVWTVRMAESEWDLLMVAVPGALVAMVMRGLASRLAAKIGERRGLEPGNVVIMGLAVMIETMATVAAIMGGLVAVQALDMAASWEALDFARPVIGLGLVVAGTLLSWRFGNELFNPLFPKSPTTEILERLVEQLEGDGPETVVEVRGPFPARTNGQIAKPVLPTTQLPAGGGTVKVELSEDYKLFVDLVALVHRAQVHGLTRAANVENVHPRLRLPSGERLSRGRLEVLWAYGADVWGLWTYEAAKGITPEWAMEPGVALDVLKAAWDRHEGVDTPPAPEAG